MKNIAIAVSDCPMWSRLDIGSVIMLPDKQAKQAIRKGWGAKASNTRLLLGERIRIAREMN